MCTRFFIEKDELVFQPIIKEVEQSPLYNKFLVNKGQKIITSGEIHPTDIVPVLAPDKNGNQFALPMKWGFHLADGTPIFNARSETAAIKPFFQEDWKRHRCIIPASYYFEWQHVKDEYGNSIKGKNVIKYAIQPVGSSITWLCGLYRIENGYPYFVILTREPVGDLCQIHDRMPLILPKDDIKNWISPDLDPTLLLSEALTHMVFEQVK